MGRMSCDPFTVSIDGDLAAVLYHARSHITNAGGSFWGDLKAGAFSGPTPQGLVQGKYAVGDAGVTITILKKPLPAECGAVEDAVRKFFTFTARSMPIPRAEKPARI